MFQSLCFYQWILLVIHHFWLNPANSAGIAEGFSMCGGDFVEVYSDASQEGT